EDVFGLPSGIRSHTCIPVCRVCLVVHGQASMGVLADAVVAIATRNIEWQHDSVASLNAANRIADLFDDSHDLVAHHGSLLESRAAFVHVKVTSADCRSRNA